MAIMNALLGFYLIEDFKLLTESGELL